MATLLTYRNDNQPYGEIALDSGDRIALELDAGGLAITRLARLTQPGEILFRGNPEVAAAICAGLLGDRPADRTTPLDILVAAVMQFKSAADIKNAFQEAAASIGK